LGQEIGRRQPPWARAGNDDGRFGRGGHEVGRLVDPSGALGEGPPVANRPSEASAAAQEPPVVNTVRFIGS
jgi:hypothetical protein